MEGSRRRDKLRIRFAHQKDSSREAAPLARLGLAHDTRDAEESPQFRLCHHPAPRGTTKALLINQVPL